MLRFCWYLADADWFARLPDAPQLSNDDRTLIGQLAALFGDEASLSPATTVAATHAILLAVEHLGDTMAFAAATHDLTELARLLCGLNLIQAHLTQTVQRIAEHVNAHTFTGISAAPIQVVQALTESLSTADANGEAFAGHLKDTHLILQAVIE